MGKYQKLVATREAALTKLKEASIELRQLMEDEERYIRDNRKQRLEIDKKKTVIGAEVTAAQAAINRVEARIPRSIILAISERDAEKSRIDADLKEARRELHGKRFELIAMRDKGARSRDLQEPQAEVTRLEERVASLEVDLEEANRGLEAAEVLKQEALETEAEKPDVERSPA
jgi:hypothetical protein